MMMMMMMMMMTVMMMMKISDFATTFIARHSAHAVLNSHGSELASEDHGDDDDDDDDDDGDDGDDRR